MIGGDWAYYMFEAVSWLNPIVHALGLGIAVWAFLRCRNRGYVWVAVYYAFAVVTLLAAPQINRAIHALQSPKVSQQTRQKIDEAIMQTVDRVLEEEGYPLVADTEQVNFPFGPILLVTGLWLIAKREPRKEAEPVGPGNAGSRPRP